MDLSNSRQDKAGLAHGSSGAGVSDSHTHFDKFARMFVTTARSLCVVRGGKMVLGPETRASLLARLNDPISDEAWREFAAIYRPLIIRVAVARGLQHADAED